MKIKNTEDVLEYPENYNYLTEEQKIIIVNYLNAVQDLADRYYDTHLEYKEDTYKHELYLKLYNQTMSELTGAKSAYTTVGIRVEYNWPGHYHKWILATRADAQNYLEHADDPYPDCDNTEQDAENTLASNGLLSYTDV